MKLWFEVSKIALATNYNYDIMYAYILHIIFHNYQVDETLEGWLMKSIKVFSKKLGCVIHIAPSLCLSEGELMRNDALFSMSWDNSGNWSNNYGHWGNAGARWSDGWGKWVNSASWSDGNRWKNSVNWSNGSRWKNGGGTWKNGGK